MSDHETTLRELAAKLVKGTRCEVVVTGDLTSAACLAGADALRRGTWQPIETAPAETWNGTGHKPVLLWWPSRYRWPVDGFKNDGRWKSIGDEEPEDGQPTHWMPLPDAPKEPTR